MWFSAIYILLFVSLIGCIVPRTGQFIGQLRGRPPGAPKKLTRLPAYTTWRTDAEPEQVGRVAAAAGLALVELRPADGLGLEAMFLELTAQTQRDTVPQPALATTGASR